MQVTVLGASGKVGQIVVQSALRRGLKVRVLVHRHNPFDDGQVTVVQGDIKNADDMRRALEGSEAVISTLGSWGTESKDILTVAMRTLVPQMEHLAIHRLVTLTGAGAHWSHDTPGGLDRLNHSLLKLLAPRILQDGEEHLKLLESSSLDWTCVRSPVMRSIADDKYRLTLGLGSPLATISRAAVAKSLLDLTETRDFNRQAPVIHRA